MPVLPSVLIAPVRILPLHRGRAAGAKAASVTGGNGIVIRGLGPGDSLAALTDLLHRAYAELGAMGFNFTAVDQSEAVTARRIRGRECWVAFVDGRLVGTVTLSPRRPISLPPWRDGLSTAMINQLAVDPVMRGQGIGGRLLDVAEGRSRDLGFTSVSLDTAESAEHLVRLYLRRGYAAVAFHRWRGKTYRSVVLEKLFLPVPGGRGCLRPAIVRGEETA